MEHCFHWLVRASWQASVLVILVLGVQGLFRQRLTARWRHGLWWLVLARLLLPIFPESGFSLFNGNRLAISGIKQITARYGIQVLPGEEETSQPNRQSRGPGRNFERATLAGEKSDEFNSGKSKPEPAIRGGSGLLRQPSTRYAPPATYAFRPFLQVLWLVGVFVLAARIAWQNYRFWRELRRQPLVNNPSMLQVLADCQQAMSTPAPVLLMETNAVKSPALYGFVRRRLLLPANLVQAFTLEELRYVFLHELAHLKRRDMGMNWLMTLALIMHWFNPLIWLAFRRMSADRELACDELVLSRTQAEETQAYGQTIIKLLESFVRPVALPGLVGILEEKTQMERRISMIAQFKKTNRAPILAIVLLASLGLLTLTDAQNQPEARKSSGGGSSTEGKAADKAPALGADPTASVSDTSDSNIIDPKTKLKFTVAKKISGENDVIEHDNKLCMSPNGKFLLWWGTVVPLDGGKPFKLQPLKEVGDVAWSPDGKMIAYQTGGIWLLPVSPETARPTGPPRKLAENESGWSQGVILWSADSEWILYSFFEQDYLEPVPKSRFLTNAL